ncbi:MAG: sulfatase-like hydrolase/transferase [Candidatus Hodarchaeota archaeon]
MEKPNILVIHCDQLSWGALSIHGGAVVQTPNIDRIGLEGARFNNFFTNSAVCTPSRGCFLTGRYPSCHGAYRNNIPLNKDEITFAHVLRDHGYHTGYGGKWHLGGMPRGVVPSEFAMGFTDSKYMFNRAQHKILQFSPDDPDNIVKEYSTDWLTDRAIEFIEENFKAPFCYMLAYPDPHGSFKPRPPYDTLLKPKDMVIPSTFSLEGPSWAMMEREKSGYKMKNPDREKKVRHDATQYYGMVKLLDDSVAKVLDFLEQKGILDDTIIVFTSDHGEYLGEHGLNGKNKVYETAYRIPVLIRWPEKIKAGTVVENICSTVDFPQTLFGLLGIKPSGREQGRDASPLLGGEPTGWVDEAVFHHSKGRYAGIFTPEYELAYARQGDHVLFDRKKDPEQINNLFSRPEREGIVKELSEKIIQNPEKYNSPDAKWLKAHVQKWNQIQ